MLPWVHLGTAAIPGDESELKLMRRGTEFSIMLGANELMNSRLSGSEEALASMTIERLPTSSTPSLLVGGLGMGFTLRAALKHAPPDAKITVAELVPEVVEWARGPVREVFGSCLDDQRVTIRVGDVGSLIKEARQAYDAILLDVDNGPEGLTSRQNDRLYSPAGLSAAREALRTGGVLAVWSQGPDRRFTDRLRGAGYLVEEAKVRASTRGGGARHVIWLAQKR